MPQLFGTAANNGQMIEEVSDKSKAADAFRNLANILTDRSEQKSERQSHAGADPGAPQANEDTRVSHVREKEHV